MLTSTPEQLVSYMGGHCGLRWTGKGRLYWWSDYVRGGTVDRVCYEHTPNLFTVWIFPDLDPLIEAMLKHQK